MVTKKGFSINRARKRLSIKPSTAKLIIKKFRTTGDITIRKHERPALPRCPSPVRLPERPCPFIQPALVLPEGLGGVEGKMGPWGCSYVVWWMPAPGFLNGESLYYCGPHF
jgi:hypothetical protein